MGLVNGQRPTQLPGADLAKTTGVNARQSGFLFKLMGHGLERVRTGLPAGTSRDLSDEAVSRPCRTAELADDGDLRLMQTSHTDFVCGVFHHGHHHSIYWEPAIADDRGDVWSSEDELVGLVPVLTCDVHVHMQNEREGESLGGTNPEIEQDLTSIQAITSQILSPVPTLEVRGVPRCTEGLPSPRGFSGSLLQCVPVQQPE